MSSYPTTNETKSSKIETMVSARFLARLDRNADELGITRSELVRTAILRQLSEVETRNQQD